MFLGSFANVLAAREENKDQQNKYLQEAREYFKKAQELSPKRQEIILELEKNYLIAEDYITMKVLAEDCIKIDPGLGECYWYMGVAEIFMGDQVNGKKHIIEGILESFSRGWMEFLPDGQHFGELIGQKVNGNPYKITGHLWVPFQTYCQEHLRYKSWGKYPKDYQSISNWFKTDLIPLFSSMHGDRQGFVEGVVFTHPDGRMAK